MMEVVMDYLMEKKKKIENWGRKLENRRKERKEKN